MKRTINRWLWRFANGLMTIRLYSRRDEIINSYRGLTGRPVRVTVTYNDGKPARKPKPAKAKRKAKPHR